MKKDSGRQLINLTFVILGIYYTLLTLHYLGDRDVKNDLYFLYRFVSEEFWLMFILELMAVGSLFADTILSFDKMSKSKRIWQLIFTVIYFAIFFAKLLFFWFGLAFTGMDF
ncbi:hypothetical protein [Halocola ammonii]